MGDAYLQAQTRGGEQNRAELIIDGTLQASGTSKAPVLLQATLWLNVAYQALSEVPPEAPDVESTQRRGMERHSELPYAARLADRIRRWSADFAGQRSAARSCPVALAQHWRNQPQLA